MPVYEVHVLALATPAQHGTTMYVSRVGQDLYDRWELDLPITAMRLPTEYGAHDGSDAFTKDELLRYAEEQRLEGAMYEQWWVCVPRDGEFLDLYTRVGGRYITYYFRLHYANYFPANGRQNPIEFWYARRTEYRGVYAVVLCTGDDDYGFQRAENSTMSGYSPMDMDA